jgi:uncharacterized NAD(P)/FAD-binding protein YdhS
MRFSVVIVGGGFSGTMLAVQLLRRVPSLSVAVIDKGSVPGRGLAYSTSYDCHLLNVPAGNMSALPEEPDHFLNWARANYEYPVQATSFLPRQFYGQYLGSLLEEATDRSVNGNFRRIRGEVSSLEFEPESERETEGYRSHINIRLKDGSTLATQSLVLAAGNFSPPKLNIPGLFSHNERYVPSAWSAGALQDIPKNGSVLLIGSGLTSIDVAVALESQGFAGHIHILSRHGLMPQPHRPTGQWVQYWDERSPRTIRGMLRLVRERARIASDAGCDWRPVIDALRPVTQKIWQSLPLDERKRFLRHVRSYWVIHRLLIAPEIDDIISTLFRNGQATLYAGRVTNYREFSEHSEVSLHDRKTGVQRMLQVDRVINCTGPETDCRRIEDPLIKSFLTQGLARPDRLFLGLDVDTNGALVDSSGTASRSLYAIGPVRKGCLWETIAVPEIRQQASELAEHLTSMLRPSKESDGARLTLSLDNFGLLREPAKK